MAAAARAAIALFGVALVLGDRSLTIHPVLAFSGFAIVLVTAAVHLRMLRSGWLKIEEALEPAASLLIVGVGDQRVTVLSVLWLAAVATGVLARGGRAHWLWRAALFSSLVVPVVRWQHFSPEYAGLCAATIALLLTCGRLTRELGELLDHARYDAEHDGLTGALSRAAFRAVLETTAAQSAVSSDAVLLLIDLDNFGQVNKSLGHGAGDALLISAVSQIRDAIGPEGIIGRLGGDEFAAIVNTPQPALFVRLLLENLERGDLDSDAVGASLGVARIPRDGRDAETLLRAGDVALRVAKRGGKHQVSLYGGQPLSDGGPSGAHAALERLIVGDGVEMVVQPIVEVGSRRVHAYEALARFRARGTSSPLHWFSLADAFGVREELELACLSAALRLLPDRPAETLLSVNLSAPVLADPRAHVLFETQPTLSGLLIEVRENSLLDSTAGLHAGIAKLRAYDVRFALDNLGAGHSGLRQITTLRPTYLKLDRALINEINVNPDRAALITALLGYARQTGGHVIAAGVETDAELATLKQLGIRFAQGYYLGAPGAPWPSEQPNTPRCDGLADEGAAVEAPDTLGTARGRTDRAPGARHAL